MNRRLILLLALGLFFLNGALPVFWTDFRMTVHITNNSDEVKRINLEKGRILEIAQVNASYYQSVIITGGDGLVEVPPRTTVQRRIVGVCLHKGLKFPAVGAPVVLTPFTGNPELITAGDDQQEIHRITMFPRENVQVVTAKGYSDDVKDGRDKDREEAFSDAVNAAARESGFTFKSETVLENLNLIRTNQRVNMEEKSIRLNNVVHEDYNEETGEYLFIGEFEVRSKPSKPEIKQP